jgi:hypothetical protein
MSPEYFPSSYLGPVPTISSETEDASTARFPRSTITGTVEDLRALLLVPLLSKYNRVPQETHWAFSLDSASGAIQSMDKATAPKHILAFLQPCAQFIPCEHEDYDDTVSDLDSEVDSDVRRAKLVLEMIQEQNLPTMLKLKTRWSLLSSRFCRSCNKGTYSFSYETIRPT